LSLLKVTLQKSDHPRKGKKGKIRMSKRQEIRQRRQRERNRNRILVILLVAAGALLIAFGFIRPMILKTQAVASATLSPVISITPKTINAAIDGVHIGDPNAPVKIDVYEDFRCSACANYTQNYEPQIIQTYVETGKVYYTFHTYLVIDGNDGTDASYRSANAAMCAGAQGRFWDYHETLYANQVSESASLYTDERLVIMAQNLNLDMTAFNKCYQAKQYANEIRNDISQGNTLKLTFTPSILVNGTLITSFDQISTIVDAALAGK
jgi:protein-disulfide isomerase